ncbi:MAG: recombinase family protein [Chloroflexi bacterium]|nr:recombinase family protein [Chloroflexota bacterium]
MIRAMAIIRVSAEDQLQGYGPDVQWFEDVLPAAPLLGLEVEEGLRRVIQEPATKWDREKFEGAIREALGRHARGEIDALLFPRVDRETRFLFGSFPLLAEVVRQGLKVYFARERLLLDPNDPDSVERYLAKATQAQAYVETMRQNTMRGRRRRALQDHKLPNGQVRWPFDYDKETGRPSPNLERAAWVRQWATWLLEEGVSTGVVCARMEGAGVLSPKGSKKWSRSTITRILSDSELIGEFYAWKPVHRRQGPASPSAAKPSQPELVYKMEGETVLTPTQFKAIQERFRANRESSSRNAKHEYPPLRGIVFCKCGRRMGGVSWRGVPYYRCNTCRKPLVKADRMWSSLREAIRELLLNPEKLIPAVRSHLASGVSVMQLEKQLAAKRAELAKWEQAEDKAVRMHLVLPDYPLEKLQERIAEIKAAKEAVVKELPDLEGLLEAARKAETDGEGIRNFCEMAAKNIDALTYAQWRLILEKLEVKVRVKEDGAVSVQMAIRPAKRDIVLQPL